MSSNEILKNAKRGLLASSSPYTRSSSSLVIDIANASIQAKSILILMRTVKFPSGSSIQFNPSQSSVDYMLISGVNKIETNISNFITSSLTDMGRSINYTLSGIDASITKASDSITNAAQKSWNWLSTTGAGVVTNFYNDPSATFGKGLSAIVNTVGKDTFVGQTINAVGEVIAQALFYKDGVTETRYGLAMERSWAGSPNSFLSKLRNGKIIMQTYELSFLENSPLDPEVGTQPNLYGNLLLGVPPLFTGITDPNNRSIINTFVKDSVFLSLTPGLPKFNGGSFTQGLRSTTKSVFQNITSKNPNKKAESKTYLNQTQTPEEMLAYLLKNGLDPDFAEKDTRYYTFQAKYSEYYSYLETMLNTIWIKMGLGTEGENKFNMYSFFNTSANTTNYNESLKEKYKSSIGFYVQNPGISEMISNSEYTSDLASSANAQSDQFQRINYITGMGTDKLGAMRRIPAVIGEEFKAFTRTMSELRDGEKGLTGFLTAVKNIATTQDLSSLVQTFSVTNGMKVMYPNLWSESSYSKNLNFNFNFVSPYGDPLSIFKYVYVPFFSLLAFALPRQAAENGYVSPLFVRADIPGLFTSDLALISDISWVKGGDTNLWTKDKLPRAISGTFTITDLYPYLAMVKRVSFLSANPSYTVFLDNVAGLHALYNVDRDPLNSYWKQMINRVSGEGNTITLNELWNDFSTDRRNANANYARGQGEKVGRALNPKSIPWMSKK
jgi:hypothetical protein